MTTHQTNIHHKEFELKEAERSASSLYNKVRKMRRNTRLQVTDHAIVRYQERVKLVSPEEVCRELVTDQVQKYYADLGDGTYPTGEGCTRVVIKDGFILTVIN